MADAVSVVRNGHRTFLKWHRGRRRGEDPVFTGRRILEGMALGASVEVDLVRHGERGFAVLHDYADLSRETTGSGPASALGAAALRALHLRGNDGKPLADRVMLLEDLCGLLQRTPPPPEALLQLDYKEGQGPLDGATVASFSRIVAPLAANMILSSGEADAVNLLTEATPGLHIGYDPCHGEWVERVQKTRDFSGFVGAALADSPKAEMVYLHYRLVFFAADHGFDIIDAFRTAGKRVDAYTINRADTEGQSIAERLLGMRVDQITTDDPEGLAARLG